MVQLVEGPGGLLESPAAQLPAQRARVCTRWGADRCGECVGCSGMDVGAPDWAQVYGLGVLLGPCAGVCLQSKTGVGVLLGPCAGVCLH